MFPGRHPRHRAIQVLILTLGPALLAQSPDAALFRRYQGLAPTLGQAARAVDAGRFDAAHTLLTPCLQQIPEHFEAHFLLARMAYAGGDFAGALAHVELAERTLADLDRRFSERVAQLKAQVEADEREAKLNLDAATARVSDPTGCASPVLAALARQVQEQEARKGPLHGHDSPYRIPADYHFLHGNALHRSGRRAAAKDQYRLALAADATHVNAWNNLIALCLEAGETAEASTELAKAEGAGVPLRLALRQAVYKAAPRPAGP